MTVHVETFCNGEWRQNCYFVTNERRQTLIIDPGSDAPAIAALIESNAWHPLAVLNTHAHYDHVGAIAPVVGRYGIPFYIHGDDSKLLRQANMYKFIFGSRESVTIPEITHDLQHQPSTFVIGGFEIEWMPTPGHTAGSVCFKTNGNLFTGDTLMSTGAGRTDLPGGDASLLEDSIARLAALDGSLTVCGGHGPTVPLSAALAVLEGAAV